MTLRDNFRDRGYHISSEKRTQENLIFNDFVPCWSKRSVPEVLHAKHSFEWKNARWQFFFSQQGGLSGMKLFGNCRVWNHLCQLLAWIFFSQSRWQRCCDLPEKNGFEILTSSQPEGELVAATAKKNWTKLDKYCEFLCPVVRQWMSHQRTWTGRPWTILQWLRASSTIWQIMARYRPWQTCSATEASP